ncbi:hypothetical protein ABZZ04_33950 [Streptomyces sp. NPDC006435]|uniref:hypothetical protein n=1 Tax=Streptomyces sp. NPDC006435 TaxID=3154300 RepID=UPI0033BC6630
MTHFLVRYRPPASCSLAPLAEDRYRSYDRRIPIVATTLDLLREHGPAGPAFWRFGRDRHQSLLDAVGNPRRDAHLARRRRTARAVGQGEDRLVLGGPPKAR